jgi:transposase
VVNVIGPNDNELNCKELSSEIAKANQYANEAQKAKKTGKPHNIGAILFFLPGYGMTLKNVEDATKAAENRALHLNKLKVKKKC